MMHRTAFVLAVLVILPCAGAASEVPIALASEVPITLFGGVWTNGVIDVVPGWDSGEPYVNDTVQFTELPYADSRSVASGMSANDTTYDLSNSAFAFTFDHIRAKLGNAYSNSRGNLHFRVDVEATYVLSGAYTAQDYPGRTVGLEVSLQDLTDSADLFDTFQLSRVTANESFTLGLEGGDSSSYVVGSLMGTLLPDHDYLLRYEYKIETGVNASPLRAAATGFLRMNFIPPIAIDIKPGSDVNPINPLGLGIVPVAILGSEYFDVADVDETTLAFGADGAIPVEPEGGELVDVNDDGFTDVLSHYWIREAGIAFGDTEACVTGELIDGTPFESCDRITAAIPCGNGYAAALVLPPLLWIGGRHRRRRA